MQYLRGFLIETTVMFTAVAEKQLSKVVARVFFLCYSNLLLPLLYLSAAFHTSVEPTSVKSANGSGSVAFCMFWCNCHIGVWALTL